MLTIQGFSNCGRDNEIREFSFNQPQLSQSICFLTADSFSLLNFIQKIYGFKIDFGILEQNFGVILIQDSAMNSNFHLIHLREVIARHREQFFTLNGEYAPNTHCGSVDHLEVDHGLCQQRITIVRRCICRLKNRFDITGQEVTGIGKLDTVFELINIDASSCGIVLVCDAVVE